MPSIINAATSGGLISTADTSGVLQLQTASTTAMTINASQNVGIGTTSPATKLQVAGNTRIDGNIEANANPFVYSWSGGTTGQVRSGIQFDGTNTLMLFYTATNERMRLPAAGGVQAVTTISVGNATPSSSGAGITFPATQSASSDANTLDDYEEGTFTPSVTNGLTSVVYTARDGRYTKVGRICYFSVYMAIGSSTRNANIVQVNLPFTAATTPAFSGGAYFAYTTSGVVGVTNQINTPTLYIGSALSNIDFYKNDGGSFTGNDFNASNPGFYIVGWFEAS
jgi:hypothetical protein